MFYEQRRAIFEKVKRHLLTQKVRSGDGERCYYQNGDYKCAVGCLISEKYYSEELEGCSIRGLAVSNAVEFSQGITLDVETIDFLTALQEIHDFKEPSLWEEHINDFQKKLEKEYIF